MKDKIFELVSKGYEVSFKPGITAKTVAITLRKKNYQNQTTIDRVLEPVDDMLPWTLDRLEKGFQNQSELATYGDKKTALIKMGYPNFEFLERYFEVHEIRYTVAHDPNHPLDFNFIYKCDLTDFEFNELQTFLKIIKGG